MYILTDTENFIVTLIINKTHNKLETEGYVLHPIKGTCKSHYRPHNNGKRQWFFWDWNKAKMSALAFPFSISLWLVARPIKRGGGREEGKEELMGSWHRLERKYKRISIQRQFTKKFLDWWLQQWHMIQV